MKNSHGVHTQTSLIWLAVLAFREAPVSKNDKISVYGVHGLLNEG